jgi:hypothetical protein
MKKYKINSKLLNFPDIDIPFYIEFIKDTFRDYLDYLFLLEEYKEPSGCKYRNEINSALENFIVLGQDNELDRMIQDDEFSNKTTILTPWFVGTQFYLDILYFILEPNSFGDFRYGRVSVFDSREVLAKEVIIYGNIQLNKTSHRYT